MNNHLKKENTLLDSTIKNVRLELEAVKEKENENAQYIRSSFMLELSNIAVQDKNENSVDIVCKVAELAKIDNFHRNQIDVAHRTSKNKMASIIVLFYKKSDRQNFYFQKKKISKVHVKRVSMEEDNDGGIVNGKPDAKSCIYVNESLTKQNRELPRKARERERERELKRNNIYIKVKGEVRVKQHEKGDHIVIKSLKDIDKI